MTALEQRATHALETIGVVKPRRSPIGSMVLVGLLMAAVGAIAAYLFDPQMGRTRRTVTRDRMAGEDPTPSPRNRLDRRQRVDRMVRPCTPRTAGRDLVAL